MKDKDLSPLTERILADLWSRDDEAIMALAKKSRVDAGQVASHSRAALLKALSDPCLTPLQAARAALDRESRSGTLGKQRTIEDIRGYLIELIQSNALPGELTLAFRDAENLSDEDLRSLIEDLDELRGDLAGD